MEKEGLDKESLNFLEDLKSFKKDELIDLIFGYWYSLRNESEKQIDDNFNYGMEEYGRIKKVQVNRLRVLTKFKLENKHN
ncbi:MAG: hypothetical protein ACOCP8_05600 [archaeon]